MRLKVVATAFAAAAAIGLLAVPADAAPKKKPWSMHRGHTVFISRDEDGRTRTRIIIQKRSYLDPGTETFPGERSDHGYASFAEPARHQACSTTPPSAATSRRCRARGRCRARTIPAAVLDRIAGLK